MGRPLNPARTGDDAAQLPGVVGQLLTEREWTIAVAESCTGGYIAHQLTNVAGASAYFDCGVVTYSNRSKHDLLHVPTDLIHRHGAVSAEVARAMAEGVRRIAGTTLGLAVTGIAGPTGGTPTKPLGTVYLALAHERGAEVEHHCLSRERIEFKMLVGAMALDMVRRLLLATGD